MNGPGKYDDLCTYAREKSDAEIVLLAVLGGNKGSGFSVQTTEKELIAVVPETLREIADQIESELTEKSSVPRN